MPDETQLEALPPAAADDAPQQPTAVQEVPVIVLSKSSSNGSSTPRKDAKLQARKEHQERVHASKVTAEAQQLVKLSTLQKDERTDGVDIVLNTLGVPMRIERFPYVPKKGKRTSDFRTPLAVRLLLQFQCEASVIFLLMALLCVGATWDNVDRGNLRAKCRAAAAIPSGYGSLVLGNQSVFITNQMYADTTAQLGFDPHDCGWTGLPIRPFPPDALSKYQPHGIPYFLRGTIGACQEFVDVNGGLAWLFGNDTIDASLIAAALANASTQDDYESCMGARGPFLPHKCNHLFVNTPRANYCLGASVGKGGTSRSKVLQLVSLLIFLLFLVRLRSVVCYTSRLEDDAIISTADYALQISGLDETLEADVLRDKLRAELEALTDGLGDFAGTIHHIEVGRRCEDEMKVLNKMSTLDLLAEEVSEQKRLAVLAGSSTDAFDKKLAKVAKDYAATKKRLVELVDEPDIATGHAFVVFHHAADRDRMAYLFIGTPQNLFMFTHPSLRHVPHATLECAAPQDQVRRCLPSASECCNPFFWCACMLNKGQRPVTPSVIVTAAPEPSEVLWENLQVSDEQELKVETMAKILLPLLVATGLVAIVLAKGMKMVFIDALLYVEWGYYVELGIKQVMTGCVAMVTVVFNKLIKVFVLNITKRAGHDTLTREEQAIFAKISWAFVFNSVFIPLFVGFFFTLARPTVDPETHLTPSGEPLGDQFYLIDPSWYEDGGVIAQAIMLMIFNMADDLIKAVQPAPILQRYGLGAMATSQAKLDALWKPAPFYTGIHYGLTLKTAALGLVYGPIWPSAYFVTSFALFLSWLCTRFGLRHWYGHPANVQGDMMMLMRWRLGQVLGLAVTMQFIAIAEATGFDSNDLSDAYKRVTSLTMMGGTKSTGSEGKSTGDELSTSFVPEVHYPSGVEILFVGAPVLLAIYVLLPLGCCKPFALEDQLSKITEAKLQQEKAVEAKATEAKKVAATHIAERSESGEGADKCAVGKSAGKAADVAKGVTTDTVSLGFSAAFDAASKLAETTGVMAVLEAGDDGSAELAFDEVTIAKGFDMPRYKCPLVDADNLVPQHIDEHGDHHHQPDEEASTPGSASTPANPKFVAGRQRRASAVHGPGRAVSGILRKEGLTPPAAEGGEADAPAPARLSATSSKWV